jgi:hypothetical protein
MRAASIEEKGVVDRGLTVSWRGSGSASPKAGEVGVSRCLGMRGHDREKERRAGLRPFYRRDSRAATGE